MTGIIYARYSSDNQRGESIDGKIRDARSLPISLKATKIF